MLTTRRALLLLAGAGVIYAAAGFAHEIAAVALTDGLSVGAAILLWVGAARQPPHGRRAWTLIATGISLWVVGDLIWDSYTLAGAEVPQPSLADGLYVAGYPVLAAGMVSMIRRRSADSWRSGLLDAVGIAMAAALAAWVFLVPASGAAGVTETLLSVVYPLGDVVLLAALAWLVLSPGIRGVPSALLLGAFGGTLGLDVALSIGAISERAIGGWFDTAYPLTYLGFALAALHERSSELTTPDPHPMDRLQPARVVFLGLALFSGPVIGTFTGSTGGAHRLLVLATTIGIGGIVLTRFVTALRELEESRVAISLVAGTDALTGLDNRRRFRENGQRCLDRLAAETAPAGALMIDIDHFKSINDTYGHAAGDAVLSELSRRCTAAIRPFDLLGRLGGDEFAVVLPQCDRHQLRSVGQRLLDLVAAEPFALADGPDAERITVTLSIGGAAGRFGSIDEALVEADAALYEAKRRGRDQLWVAPWSGSPLDGLPEIDIAGRSSIHR